MGWLSSLIAFSRDERVILVSIGLASFGIVSTMVTALAIIRDDSAVPPQQPKTRYITQETEDSLELDTLERLLEYPNYSIREIATKILCERAVNNKDTIRHLLYGITRPDYDERMQSLRALVLLTGQATDFDGLSNLNTQEAYSALVRSLELGLDDVERPKLDDHHWDEYYLRDMAERLCLMFVLELINKYGSRKLIRAKFVEKWLSKQEWGENPEERRENFTRYMEYKNNRIVDIVSRIQHWQQGVRALKKAGLQSPREAPSETVIMMDQGADVLESQAPRARDQSAEEQRLRRQHREAMVLNDGTRPFGREDIIERDHGSPS